MSEEKKVLQDGQITEAEEYFKKYELNPILDKFFEIPEVADVITKVYERLEADIKQRVETFPLDVQEEVMRRKPKDFFVLKSVFTHMVKSTCKNMVSSVIMKSKSHNISDKDIKANCLLLMDSRFNIDNLWIIETYASSTANTMLETLDGMTSGDIVYPFTVCSEN